MKPIIIISALVVLAAVGLFLSSPGEKKPVLEETKTPQIHESQVTATPEQPEVLRPTVTKNPQPSNPKDVSKYFKQTELDQALLHHLQSRMNGAKSPSLSILTKNPKATVDAANEAYFKMSATAFKLERANLLDSVDDVMLIDKKEENIHIARDFYKSVVEKEADPINPKDPLDSTTLVAMRNFLNSENDDAERKRLANLILSRNRSPQMKNELQRLMINYQPWDHFSQPH